MTDQQSSRSPLWLTLGGAVLLVSGVAAGWFFESRRTASGEIGDAERARIEQVVQDYLLEHPEILPQAIEKLRANESLKQLGPIVDKVMAPYPGAVLGNPNGTVTLVEFSDFACTFCRHSEADLEALIAENPDLKVVIRQLPIIAPTSPDAARWGLAAAAQGKYAAFHKTMFAAGRTDAATIRGVARLAGLDLAQASQEAQNPAIQKEIETNIEYARRLGFDGTPCWVVGDQIMQGAVGKEALAKAIAEARKS